MIETVITVRQGKSGLVSVTTVTRKNSVKVKRNYNVLHNMDEVPLTIGCIDRMHQGVVRAADECIRQLELGIDWGWPEV